MVLLGDGGIPQVWPPRPSPLFSPHQLALPREEAGGQIVLSGNSGMAAAGPFAVDQESGFLMVTMALDREEQAEYQLQVCLDQRWEKATMAGGVLSTLPCRSPLRQRMDVSCGARSLCLCM